MPLDTINLDAWDHGFFGEILSLMDHLGQDCLTREEITEYRDYMVRRMGYLKSNPNPKERAREMLIKKGCKTCEDENEEVKT